MTLAQEQVIVKISADVSKLSQQMKNAENNVKKSTDNMMTSVKRLATVIATSLVVKKVIDYGDAWANLEGKIKLVTNSSKGLAIVQNELVNIAVQTRANLSGTVTLYTKLARSTKGLGYSQKELLDVTKTINEAMIVSGATAIEAESALMQLGQGLASGTLRGEELNSILEQTPRLAEAIASGMGIAVGQLKDYGSQGLISSETVINALKNQADAVNREFKQMPNTVGQAFESFKTSALTAIGKIDQSLGLTSGLASTIDSISSLIRDNTNEMITFGAFASSVLERTKLLFVALGLTIKTGFLATFNSVKLAFGEFNLMIVSGIYQMVGAINKALEALGAEAIDRSGIASVFQSVSYEVASAKDGIIQAGNEAKKAWLKFAGYDISENAKQAFIDLTAKTNDLKNKNQELNQEVKMTNDAVGQGKGFWELWEASAKKALDEATNKANQVEALVSGINNSISDGLTSAFRDSLDGIDSWAQTFEKVLKDILAQIFKVIVAKKVAGMITGGVDIASLQANGGVWSNGSQVQAFAKGGVVDSPTTFGMSGGQTGLMGEAGPEAIMPLGRMANGDLGVKGVALNVNVINNAGVDVQTSQEGDDFNITLTRIDSAMADGIRRRTSQTSQAILGLK